MRDKMTFMDQIISLYQREDPKVRCPVITFQVTDDCCLKCSYCYQIAKGHKMMSHEVMKEGIDLLFQMYDENKEDAVINHHTKGIVIEFIGGEPFINTECITYGSKYFIDQCLKRDHIWLTNFRFSFSTNGMLYFTPEVQEYINTFKPWISLGITLDGPKEFHDKCRKDLNGEGSFDTVFKAYKDWTSKGNNPNTKITISPDNLPELNKIADFFIDLGCDEINANPIFEEEWTIEQAKIYYEQLKQLADKFLTHPDIKTNILGTFIGHPLSPLANNNWCGGTGAMLAFDPDGNAFPCLRYMESSLGKDKEVLNIGDIHGIYNTEKTQALYKDLTSVTRRSQSTDECFYCPVASNCAWCSAYNYQKFGTYNKRATGICWMQRARSLANSYYLNKKYILEGSAKRFPLYLQQEFALQIIDEEEYHQLLTLSLLK